MCGQNAPDLSDIEVDEDEVTRLYRRLNNAREHVWRRWQREYIHSLILAHRITVENNNFLRSKKLSWWWEQRNRGEWMKGRVARHVKGRDGVARGVILLHKGKHIQRTLQLVCRLEIRSMPGETAGNVAQNSSAKQNRGFQDETQPKKRRPEYDRSLQMITEL